MLIVYDKPRQWYIDNHPNCGFDCRGGEAFRCCTNCGMQNGFFEEHEAQVNIEVYRQKNGSFLTRQGCALPLNLRSYKCLSWDCKRVK
jgi:hypothetical protein